MSGIPHFKEVVIMATVCDYCGHKTNEVKSGGGIESQGKKITLRLTEISDLSRDVLKVRVNTDQKPAYMSSLGNVRPAGIGPAKHLNMARKHFFSCIKPSNASLNDSF